VIGMMMAMLLTWGILQTMSIHHQIFESIAVILLMCGVGYFAWNSWRHTCHIEKIHEQLHQIQGHIDSCENLSSLGGIALAIAHEVKNPLNFILNFSELTVKLVNDLQNEASSTAQGMTQHAEALRTISNNLAVISKQSRRANRILQRILQHARSSIDDALLTDIHELLDDYLTLSYQSMRIQAPHFNVTISKQFNAVPAAITIHPEDIGRVLLNIFSNGYYALQEKKRQQGAFFEPTLTVSTCADGSTFEIHIRDNGIGMSPKAQAQIFTPFFTTKPPGMGTGLGLTLSRTIIEEGHGGRMFLKSHEGEGTELIIQLPIVT
jgi:signal transduction histidine kinase